MRAKEFIIESLQQTTLAKLYGGNYPDRDETFWDYVSSSEFNTPLDIQTLARHKVMIMLLGQYRAEHIDDVTDMLDDDRKELVQSYVDDPALSSKVIVLSGDRIIDGNHRALAAAIKGVPINYVDLADLEETDEIDEAEASDAALAARYGEFDPEDKPMLPRTQVGGAPSPTLWTVYQTIQNILGRSRVTDDEDAIEPGMYYVYQSNQPPMFRDTEESGTGGSINLPNIDSTAAADIAVAAHEAYHAYVHDKTSGSGQVHSKEKIINNLAEKWLRNHLTGPELHVALEKIVGSRISYGTHHMPNKRNKK